MNIGGFDWQGTVVAGPITPEGVVTGSATIAVAPPGSRAQPPSTKPPAWPWIMLGLAAGVGLGVWYFSRKK